MAGERIAPDAAAAPRLWLVDGFNVLHAVLLGGRDRSEWWTEARRAELVALVRQAGAEGRFEVGEPAGTSAEVWVVFDGARDPGAACPGPVREVFAPSADEWLVAQVRQSQEPSRLAVVTADRRVADRSRHRGARVVSPRDFVARCRGADCPPPPTT